MTITDPSTTLNGYQYEAVFSNGNPGTLTTNPATLSVLAFSSTPTINMFNQGNVTVSGTGSNVGPISVVITDSASHTATAATTTVSGGTWSVSGINASGLLDGTVTYTVTQTDALSHQATLTQTATKYTVAPAAAFTTTPNINIANASSLAVSGTGDNGDSISVVIHDTASHTTTVATTTVSGGTWSVSGINAGGLTDGTVTYAVTETDVYANSTTVTQTEPKITLAPRETFTSTPNVNIANAGSVTVNGTGDNGDSISVVITDTASNTTTAADDHGQRRYLVGQRHQCQRVDRRFSYLLGHRNRRGRQQHHDYTVRGEDHHGPDLVGNERPVHQHHKCRQRHG